MLRFMQYVIGIACIVFYSGVKAQTDCLNSLEPVTEFFQAEDETAQWQIYTVNDGQFAVLDISLDAQKLDAVLNVLDINNEGALFMRLEQQSLWLFKIEQCVYSLVASPLSDRRLHLQLTAYIAEQKASHHEMHRLGLPLRHYFSDLQSGEEFYAFEWFERDVKRAGALLERSFKLSERQIAGCLEYGLCAFEYKAESYLLSWIKHQEKSFLLLFRQPCSGVCDVGF